MTRQAGGGGSTRSLRTAFGGLSRRHNIHSNESQSADGAPAATPSETSVEAVATAAPIVDIVVEPVATRASWFRSLKSLADLFISVELTHVWYLHLVYAKKDGAELRNLFTQRFAALTTMISLLVASQVGALFSPSRPTEEARTALENLDHADVGFWAGLFLIISLIFSVLSLLATLSAWTLFNSIGCNNAHIILRSSMCLAAAALPVRLAVMSIYSFFVWINLFFYVIADVAVAAPLSVFTIVLGIYIISLYSAVGRTIMYSGALSNERILQHYEEEELTGAELATALVEKTIVAKEGAIPVNQQYRIRYQEQLQILEEGGSLQLSDLMLTEYQDGEESDVECGDGTGGGADDDNNTNSTCLGPLSISGKED